MGTKLTPGQFDAYSKAFPDEPMFVMLGRDPLAASVTYLWAMARPETCKGDEPAKLQEARVCALELETWCINAGRQPMHLLDALPFDVLAETLRKRGATVTPAPHAGDFAQAPYSCPTCSDTKAVRAAGAGMEIGGLKLPMHMPCPDCCPSEAARKLSAPIEPDGGKTDPGLDMSPLAQARRLSNEPLTTESHSTCRQLLAALVQQIDGDDTEGGAHD